MGITDTQQSMTLAEAAEYMKISTKTMSRWLRGKLKDTPQLPAIRVGRQWRIRKVDLDQVQLAS